MTILCCQVGGFVEDFVGVLSALQYSLVNFCEYFIYPRIVE